MLAASPEARQTIRHGRPRVLVNTHETPVADAVRHPDAELRTDLLIDKLRFAAGDALVNTFDAQALAESVMGHTLGANIVALGMAWQRGLVPVGWAALEQAVRLNKVAVDDNLLALAIGRLAAQAPEALAALIAAPAHAEPDSLDAFVEHAVQHLQAWQNAAWAARYRSAVERAQRLLSAHPDRDALALVTARSLHKLMSYKDEYEVARLFSDASFQAQLDAQFEGDYQLAFHMAPPALAFWKKGASGTPRKITLGSWLRPALRLLAHGRRLRGTALDPFGHTHERRMERQLIATYLQLIEDVLPQATADNSTLVHDLLALPLSMRGFGHVKERNVRAAQTRQAWLLHRLDPARFAKPQQDGGTQQLRGIRVKTV